MHVPISICVICRARSKKVLEVFLLLQSYDISKYASVFRRSVIMLPHSGLPRDFANSPPVNSPRTLLLAIP